MTAQATLSALLDAGLRLARSELPFARLDAAAVAAAAGVKAEEFKQAYGGMEAYLEALQRRFLDGLRGDLIEATTGLAPGYERARLGAISFLDGCLKQRGLRSWLLDARLRYPNLQRGLQGQNQAYLLILPGEFAALRWPHPQAGARLFLAALQEVSRLEHGLGRASSELRNALWQFLRTHDGR